VRQDQLEQTDRVSTVGDRQDQSGTLAVVLDVDLLSPQHLLVHGVGELQGRTGPVALA
jgi:hypothetical protein